MKKKAKKICKIIVLILLGIFLIREVYSTYVDMYNFRQLEKAKPILENIPKDAEQFYSLNEFNNIYSANIKTIKNCYHIKNNKSEDRVPYIFAFQLESLIYIYIYGTREYSYPKYDAPYIPFCEGGIGCHDRNKIIFKKIISNRCEE